MGNKIDELSYSIGYQDGWEAANDEGYTRGWQDSMETHEKRIRSLEAERLMLEAHINALARRTDERF